MHYEDVEVPVVLIEQIKLTQSQGILFGDDYSTASFRGSFRRPFSKGQSILSWSYEFADSSWFDFKVVDGLLTNFLINLKALFWHW